ANLPGWLYRITDLCARNHKRMAWFKNLFRRHAETAFDERAHTGPAPVEAMETLERRRHLERLLNRLSEKHRTTLVLFEIEGYSGDGIAVLQGIHLATVWTRLHHARKELFALLRNEGAER